MKLLHTSDWHLGRIFHNVSLLEDQAFVLDQIIAYAAEYEVDAVLVAGDIFDRAVPPAPAIALLDDTLHKLTQEYGIPVVLISGNHDSAERLAFGSRLLANQNLHIIHDIQDSNQPIMLRDKAGQSAAFFGIPYLTPELVRSEFSHPAKTFDEAHSFMVWRTLEVEQTTDFRVLISHCFVDGAEECDSERPLAIGGSDRVSAGPMKAFDYVALGHLHGQQRRGYDHVRYSGSPMKYSFSEEKHKKAITLVELERGKPTAMTQLPLSPLRNMRRLSGEFDQLIEQAARDNNAEDFLAITLTDKHAILDAMSKLREVYPNVLQLEKEYLQNHNSQINSAAKKELQQNEQAMFADFYREITNEPLDEQQTNYLNSLLKELHADEIKGEQSWNP